MSRTRGSTSEDLPPYLDDGPISPHDHDHAAIRSSSGPLIPATSGSAYPVPPGFEDHTGGRGDELNSYLLHERAAFEEAKHQALRLWARRAIVVCVLQLISAILFIWRSYFLSTCASVLMALFGLYGAKAKKSEPIFAYLVLNVLNVVKDIGIAYLYVQLTGEWVMVVCDIALTPLACYVGFYLYQSLHAEAATTSAA